MAVEIGKKRFLNAFSFICSMISTVLLLISVSTTSWLSTYERRNLINGTEVTEVVSGLWLKCVRVMIFYSDQTQQKWTSEMTVFPENVPVNCTTIKYFQKRLKAFADLKPPEIVLFEMQPGVVFPIVSVAFLLSGCICSLVSHIRLSLQRNKLIAGVCYVVSGLSLLIGIVIYVGSISQSFDSSSNSINGESKYLYTYGTSFYLTIISFVLTKTAGVVALYHYIAKKRHLQRLQSKNNHVNHYRPSESQPMTVRYKNILGNNNASPGNYSEKTQTLLSSLKPLCDTNQSPIFRINKSEPNLLSQEIRYLRTNMYCDVDTKVYEDTWAGHDNYLLSKFGPCAFQTANENVYTNFGMILCPMRCSKSLYSLQGNKEITRPKPRTNGNERERLLSRKVTSV